MPTVTLNEMDVRAFLTAFNAIVEVTSYDFDDETEYRLAIANLVGELKSQLPPVPREIITVTPRIDLASALAGKYAEWDAACAGGSVCQSAASLVAESLEKCGHDGRQFAGGEDAGEAIGQFRAIVTAQSAAAWQRYELALCATARDELDSLNLADMLGELIRLTDESR